MKTKRDYLKLLSDLEVIERRVSKITGNLTYLQDRNIDRENVELPESDPLFWDAMWHAAGSAAGLRAEQLSLDINKELGYVVY